MISVLVSTYNGAAYLDACLESIIGQRHADFECLLVDDGSDDGSEAIAQRFAKRDKRVNYLGKRDRCGLYQNLNYLANLATGNWLKLLGQDDVLANDHLASCKAFVRRHPEVELFWSATKMMDAHGNLAQNRVDETPSVLDPRTAFWYMLHHGCLPGNISSMILSKHLWLEMKGFRDHIAADFAALVTAAKRGPLGFCRDASVTIRQHAQQWSRRPDSTFRFLDQTAPLFAEVEAAHRARSRVDCSPQYERLARQRARSYGGVIVKTWLRGSKSDRKRVSTHFGSLAQQSQIVASWLMHRLR